MSKITKAICYKCEKEIDFEDWYYSADITNQSNSCNKGERIMFGDFCDKCFKELINQRIKTRRTIDE